MAAPWTPKMVAIDIDGTLVDREGVLPESMKEAVQRVLAHDVPVVIATGRSWDDARPVWEALELEPAPVVLANGAIVIKYPPYRLLKQVTFDPGPVIEQVIAEVPHVSVAVEDPEGGYRLNRLFPEGDLSGKMTIQSVEELTAKPVMRVIIRDPDGTPEDFKALTTRLGMKQVSYFIGWSAWLDIAPVGVNKATGLKQAAAELGVRRKDVLAIGDGRNDVHMLKWAGRGVAVGDAPPEVQRVADSVTGTFAAGGTQAELLKYFR